MAATSLMLRVLRTVAVIARDLGGTGAVSISVVAALAVTSSSAMILSGWLWSSGHDWG